MKRILTIVTALAAVTWLTLPTAAQQSGGSTGSSSGSAAPRASPGTTTTTPDATPSGRPGQNRPPPNTGLGARAADSMDKPRTGIDSEARTSKAPNPGLTPNEGPGGPGGIDAARPGVRGGGSAAVGAQGDIQAVAVSRLIGKQVVDPTGDQVGSIASVVAHGDKFASLIVGSASFLGLGGKEVAVPIGQAYLRNDKVVLRSIGVEQFKLEDAWTGGSPDARAMSDDETVTIAVR